MSLSDITYLATTTTFQVLSTKSATYHYTAEVHRMVMKALGTTGVHAKSAAPSWCVAGCCTNCFGWGNSKQHGGSSRFTPGGCTKSATQRHETRYAAG